MAAIQPLLPTNQPGARRVDDRRVLSGIIHVLRSGCRWQDTPAVYGPPTTVYNRFHRWSQRGIWQGLFASLVEVTPGGIQAIDSTTAKAQRAATGGNGVADGNGRLIAFILTAGQVGDHKPAAGLLGFAAASTDVSGRWRL